MENSPHPGNRKDLKQAYRTAYLIAGFLKNNLTQEEKEELDQWILASDENMMLFEEMTDDKNLEKAADWFKKMDVERDLIRTHEKMVSGESNKFWRYAIAAAIILALVLGTCLYIVWTHKETKNNVLVFAEDITPGSARATLTLENNQQIVLDNIGKDSSINSQVNLIQHEGEIVYKERNGSSEIAFNTLTIPRKGHYKLQLPDGTIVWLNSESSIRFPVDFSNNERKVFVTGETFFQVAKDKTKPFRVVANDVMIEALGTEFNVNAYANEPYTAATLVEGSVVVTKGKEENILKPGQQAQISGEKFQIVPAEAEEVMAWKNDQFKFKNTPIETIMRQVERWYDADVLYQDRPNLHLNATISRQVPVSKLLHVLEETEQIHFKIEGKKIYVMK